MTLTEVLPTPERALAAARQCFSSNGFHSTSMKTICKACDISPGTLYHHFPSKEALIQAIIAQDQERALTHFRDPIAGEGLVDYLVDSFLQLAKEDQAQRALVVEIMAEGMRNAEVARMLEEKYQAITELMTARLSEAREAGVIGATVDLACAARLLLTMNYGTIADAEALARNSNDMFTISLKNMLNGLLQINTPA
ncbi:TetR/AcrR family transcriptional regulator [Buttiauxella sp. A2-C1_F]|uniref:TetR/AcrR family transcriptional regulator n=1 Tax=unclassified Buttiauxella TaxID=2634062 RepID=UPI001E51DB14|nr:MULTISPECIES: TetR/AcrR family transcriptional regulator [unclassified Buttiauxella]MCE0800445.1 TetR/AcrR family transcriptional regulator [Buttiauxella sp. W03-F01]MCE0812570.1 TetR/AcrR family transcriptional regulator [Buttiauxella sp. S04-F03]MCE0846527.1 TetR/AcrR family transcriptional regulator [Buttiauxella sp. A2-C1_F]